MYINIGSNTLVRKKDIIGIFDLDTSSHEKDTRDFLKTAEKNGIVEVCGTDLPKSFVLVKKSKKEKGFERKRIEAPYLKSAYKTEVYLTTLSSASLAGRNNKGL
ncbi:MAG: DUF370 domain-containing protein [Ruminococcaceae bacterium]|nr:DUF370 domain-containing protein [Oscillospiraceae bacterium]